MMYGLPERVSASVLTAHVQSGDSTEHDQRFSAPTTQFCVLCCVLRMLFPVFPFFFFGLQERSTAKPKQNNI